jgi:hypothetical protein
LADFRAENDARRETGFVTSERFILYSGAAVLGYLLGLGCVSSTINRGVAQRARRALISAGSG